MPHDVVLDATSGHRPNVCATCRHKETVPEGQTLLVDDLDAVSGAFEPKGVTSGLKRVLGGLMWAEHEVPTDER